MTLAPSSPPPAYTQAPRRNGCLWGCLVLLLLVALPPVLMGGYGAWFLWNGYRRDPVFIAGQGFGVFVYLRNLYFVLRESKNAAAP